MVRQRTTLCKHSYSISFLNVLEIRPIIEGKLGLLFLLFSFFNNIQVISVIKQNIEVSINNSSKYLLLTDCTGFLRLPRSRNFNHDLWLNGVIKKPVSEESSFYNCLFFLVITEFMCGQPSA